MGDFTFSGSTITGYTGTATDITIPSVIGSTAITTIGDSAFVSQAITSVIILSGIITIGENAFGDCMSLTSVSIPTSVTTIGNGAFVNCYVLTSITIPSSVSTISDNAFDSCIALSSVSFSAGLTAIGIGAFNSTALTSVSFPAGLLSIGIGAFDACVLSSITFQPGPSITIGDNAFRASSFSTVALPAGSTSVAGRYIQNKGITQYHGSFPAETTITFLRNGVPCFIRGTLIRTPSGEVAVEELTQGDLVTTASGLIVRIKGIYTTHVERTTKETAPYLIPAGTYGSAQPKELILSPVHAFQIRKSVWMVPAMASLMNPAIRQIFMGESVDYFHLECPVYLRDNLIANNCIVESFGLHQTKKSPYTFSKRLGGYTRPASSTEVYKGVH